MTSKTRRRLRLVAVVLLLLVLSACIFLPDFPRQYSSGKYDPADVVEVDRPNVIPNAPRPGKQTEPHTCGWHAMYSMYAAYGMNSDEFDLRFRLGTDEPAMRVDEDSTGTLHPDLYRVLAQDGFAITPLDLEADSATSELKDHLVKHQLALVVVYRSTYHWVLIGPAELADELMVYDSLKEEPSTMSIDAMIDESLSITLVEPHGGEPMSTSAAHAEGLAEMRRLYQRKQ